MRKVTVVDYGAGNLLSVVRALAHVGAEPVLADTAAEIASADMLVLPGVGAFGRAMAELRSRGLVEALQAYGVSGRPFLGICLGKQLMMDSSQEFGSHGGLGLLAGAVVPVPSTGADGRRHRIPHIGWADIRPPAAGRWHGTIFQDLAEGAAVYFVHSLHAVPADPQAVLAVADYDGVAVNAAVQAGPMAYGCQFHPEKSGEVGLSILRRFVEL